jgi:octaprenyl-diphosphate synthase
MEQTNTHTDITDDLCRYPHDFLTLADAIPSIRGSFYQGTPMQSIQRLVAEEFAAVNELIMAELHSDVPLVEDIGHHLIHAGGKRLRPLLTLLCAGLSGGIKRDHIALAAIIEFIHTATLLHDDVVDISALRRGKPTANAQWGNAPSVLVGDFLYSRAFQMMVRIGHLPLMDLLADTTNTIAEGEVLQLTKAGNADISEDEYYGVITRKTAILFAAAAEAAGLLSGQTKEQSQALHQHGLALGIAFQLIDDALDYEGDSAVLGKNIGDDLQEGKVTLPLIYVLKHAPEADRQIVKDAIKEKSVSQLSRIIDIVRNHGGLEYTHKQAQYFAEQAIKHVQKFPDSTYRQALIKLLDIAINRTL